MSLVKWSHAVLISLAFAGVGRAESVEEAEKKLIEAHSKMKTYTSKTKTTQNFPGTSADYGGTVEWKRDGDKFTFRTEMKGTTTQGDNKTEVTVLMICDGDFLYTVTEQMGQKMAFKQKPDPSATGDPKKLFEKIHSDNDIKLLPDEKVDGTPCYVFEVVPKNKEEGPMSKSIMYFSKESGINIKNVGKDKDGKDVFTNASTDVKLNVDIPNDRFVFKAPEGVQIMDMTGATP